jgi:predicted PurR-regulated permease PerM
MPDDSKEYVIHVSTSTVIRSLLVLALTGLAWYLRDVLLIVLTAIVLASAIEPLVRMLVKQRIPRIVSLIAVYVGGGLFLGSIVYFFVPAFLDDVSQLSHVLPEMVSAVSIWDPLGGGSVANQVLLSAAGSGSTAVTTGFDISQVLGLFKSGIEEGGALKTVSVFFGGFLSFVLIIVLSFYFSAQEKGIEGFLRLVSPIKSRAYIVDLWRRSQQKIGLWSQGQLVLGLLVGVLVFLVTTLLGIPSALFLAVLAATFELIPVFGPILSAVPAVVLALTHGINPPAHLLSVAPGITAGTARG